MNTNELVEAFVQRLGTELKELLDHIHGGRLPASAIKTVVRQKLWHFGGQAVAVLLEALDKTLVKSQPVHDRRTRTVVTLFGHLCRYRCKDGRYPVDEALGLVGQSVISPETVAVQEAVCLLSCECSFQTSSDLMGSAAGGLVVGMDGCQAPRRDGWHEVKVATVYRNESRSRKASGRGRVIDKEYIASVEKAERFGRQCRQAWLTPLWQVALTWGIEQARRVVCMSARGCPPAGVPKQITAGDGAAWIWNLVAEHFPGAIEIVDFYHALESACGGWQVGEALWGDRGRSEQTRGWVRHYGKQLRRGRVDLVIGAIERGRECLKDVLSAERADIVGRDLARRRRVRSNRGRMEYARYRRKGLAIGTGIVEGSCKFVVQSRFKRPGSRWNEDGLRWLLALKLMRLNKRWELLWPHLKAA